MSGSPRYQNTIKQLFKLAFPEVSENPTVFTIKQTYPKFRSSARSDWYDVALDCIGILRPDSGYCGSGGYGNRVVPHITEVLETTTQLIEEVLASNAFSLPHHNQDSQYDLIPELAIVSEEPPSVVVAVKEEVANEDDEEDEEEDDEDFCEESFLRDAAKKREMLSQPDGFIKLMEDVKKRTDYVNNAYDLLKIVETYTKDCVLIAGFVPFVHSDEQKGKFAGFKFGHCRTPDQKSFYSNLIDIYFKEYVAWFDDEDSLNDSKIYDQKIEFWFEVEDVRLNFEFVCCEGNLYLTNDSGEKDLVSKFLENWFTKDVFWHWLRESEHPLAISIRIAKKLRERTEKSKQNFARKLTA